MHSKCRLFAFIVIFFLINTALAYYRSFVQIQGPLTNQRMSALSAAVDSSAPSSAGIQRLVKQTANWCGLHGLIYTDGGINFTPAPIAMVPQSFPRSAFQYATSIQPALNKLIDRISRDREFLIKELTSVSASDEFTARVLELYKSVPDDIVKNGLQLGILRSDYMVNYDGTPLQVEVNTISSSFGYLSHKVSQLHGYLLDRNSRDPTLKELIQAVHGSDVCTTDGIALSVLENKSAVKLAKAIAAAHDASPVSKKSSNAKVLFLVQPGERNQADQRAFESQLWTGHKVPAEFMTLAEVAARGRVDTDGTLMVRPVDSSDSFEVPVSVAYFRAGYAPTDYPTEVEWTARELIEKSTAVKCPSAGYQLAGTKAIQATLCLPQVLEKFLDADECELVRRCFASQYSLADPTAAAAATNALEEAAADGTNWVLKPQREGGGNNFYGEELSEFLRNNRKDSAVMNGYVLMQRIFPQPQKTAFFRKGDVNVADSISELGVYGTYLGTGKGTTGVDDVFVNDYAGYLLRTKQVGVDEGGVATGYSVLSSIVLVE